LFPNGEKKSLCLKPFELTFIEIIEGGKVLSAMGALVHGRALGLVHGSTNMAAANVDHLRRLIFGVWFGGRGFVAHTD
jgi:hypothetical protein